MRIALLIPCYVDQIYPQVGVAVVRILEKLGHHVEVPGAFTCCGQPPFNAGFWAEAREIARPVLSMYRNADAVVVPSGSCAAMLRVFNPELFKDTADAEAAQALSARTYEFSEFLVDKLGVTDVGARFEGRVTFHDGCHGLRELGAKRQPRELLKNVRGLQLTEMADVETCCGFGGTFSVKFPQISAAMGQTKCKNALATEANVLVSNDSSCLMHLQGLIDRNGNKLRCMHLAEVLAHF